MAKKKQVVEEVCCEEEVAETPKASQVVHDIKTPLPLWSVIKELEQAQHLYNDLWYWDGEKFDNVREVCSVGDKLVVK